MLNPNYDASIAFLRLLRPGGPWVLTAIHPDQKKIETATFRDEGEACAWLGTHGEFNCYYSVNPTLRDLQKKADREDISALEYLHVDVDPRAKEDPVRERERAIGLLRAPPGGIPIPTGIVSSGGGFNALWKLRDPVRIDGKLELAEEAKLYNLQIETVFQADRCHNVDRILRLPGTVNWPNAVKRKKGREPALAELVEWAGDRVYDIEQFMKAPVVQTPGPTAFSGSTVKVSGNVRRLASLEELPAKVPEWCKILVAQGRNPDDPTKYQSRSEALWAAVCELVRSGVEDDVIFAILTDREYGISESVLEKGSSAERYAVRQIEQAKEHAIAPELRELNARHAVIGNYGGKCRVIEEVIDANTGRPRLTHQNFECFTHRYMNRKVYVGDDEKSRPIHVPLGKWWLGHSSRRQYDRVVFSPGREVEGAYNLWRGFDCEARPGDCSLFLEHLRENLCGGVGHLYEYLVGWMANAVQRPAQPGYAAVVMRGDRGVGKSYFAKTFGSLWGRHFLHVAHATHLVGNFNAHLRDCCVLFADEAFWAGDKKNESVLKALITEETMAIEAKGIDVEASANFLHLILASNDRWVVPAGWDERRFLVLDVSPAHAQDTAYFGRMENQMRSGGREALLHMLLGRNLEGYDVRTIPKTAALQDQKDETISRKDPVYAWFLEALRSGDLSISTRAGQPVLHVEQVATDTYRAATRDIVRCMQGARWDDVTSTKVGRFLSRVGLQKREKPRGFVFPPLLECRAAWDRVFGPQQWGPETEWEAEVIAAETTSGAY